MKLTAGGPGHGTLKTMTKATLAIRLGAAALALSLAGGAHAATGTTTVDANLRRTPAQSSLVLRVVPRGTLLTIACAGQWCRTSFGGRGGYVLRAQIRPLTRSAPLSGTFYASCAAVRAAGKAPLRLGAPGYRTGLDSNGNGVACDQGDR